MLLAFLGSCEDEQFNTQHPKEGGLILTTEWSDNATAPAIYQACVISQSGIARDFENLSGMTNSLVVEPGDATLYIYNDAEQIRISDDKATATVTSAGAGIAANPGTFFSYYGQIHTKQDQDIPYTALMSRRIGGLKLSIAIKPAAMIDRVKAIYAELEGVASKVNLRTGALSNPSSVYFPLPRNTFYAIATVRLLGFDPAAGKSLKLDVEFENGNIVSITKDISSLVKDFDASKSDLFSLNATMSVSDGEAASVTVDNWECNTESRYLSLSASEVSLSDEFSEESVTVTTDQPSWEYSVIVTGDWLTIDKNGTQLYLSASANTDSDERRATVNISAGGLSESVTIIQSGYTPPPGYADREVVKLQSATVGKGVNLVMMGDGYTAKDMGTGDGKYERDMRTATESFFSVYPYSVYRDHFNVYMVAAISNEEGISIESSNTTVDTKFNCRWEGPHSTGIHCNSTAVVEYLFEIPELANADINDITVIIPINAYIYAGTCMMGYYGSQVTNFGNGFSISMCPVGSDFKEIVVHEAGGHGFSKVMDEYYASSYYHPNETIPDDEKNQYIYYKENLGWCENIDFYDDILLTSWRGFAGMTKYDMVGTFEGAAGYGKGIWRPEFNSCMNNNVLYFNAPTRWAQVRRIKRLAGFDYSFQQFLQDDVVPEYPSGVRSGKPFTPLARPVIMDMMKDFHRKKSPRTSPVHKQPDNRKGYAIHACTLFLYHEKENFMLSFQKNPLCGVL
jgi:hypothetical protein